MRRLEEERLAAEQEAARQAYLELEMRREAKERERMHEHDEDIGEPSRKMRRRVLGGEMLDRTQDDQTIHGGPLMLRVGLIYFDEC